MWEPRRLKTLWASTACYWDSFTSLYTYVIYGATGAVYFIFITCLAACPRVRLFVWRYFSFRTLGLVQSQLQYVRLPRRYWTLKCAFICSRPIMIDSVVSHSFPWTSSSNCQQPPLLRIRELQDSNLTPKACCPGFGSQSFITPSTPLPEGKKNVKLSL
jgi:hypothetical protein